MGVSPTADGLSAVSAMLARFDTPDESIVVQVGVPELFELRPDLLGDVHRDGRHVGRKGQAVRRPEVDRELRREDRRLHLVRPGGRSARHQPLDQRGDRRLRLLPGHRDAAPRTARWAESRQCGLPARRQHRQADRQLVPARRCTTISAGSGTGIGCANVGDVSNGRKNALQTDPTAAGNVGSFVVNRAYMGDIDGKYWRFSFTSAGAISANWAYDTGPADLRLVGPAVRRQRRHLRVLRDRQRSAAGYDRAAAPAPSSCSA